MRSLLLTGSSVLVLAGSAAQAQEAQRLEEVVVTASRAAATGFTAPTPTSIVSNEMLDRQGASGVSQVLNQIPAFKATQTPSANGTRTATIATAPADLRGLGAQRTLVLVNGKRVVPFAPTATTGVVVATDLNLIPTLMIDRVEVVTGGASAQWGSDAVGGVVNILLKNKFEGLQLKGSIGQSQEGDFQGRRLGAIAGTAFADGRGHIVIGGDYDKNDGLGDIYTRDWGREEYQVHTNPSPATNGLPAFIIAPQSRSNLGINGLITGPANFSLRNFEFDQGGQSVSPYQNGALPNGTWMIGGEGRSLAYGIGMAPAVERFSTYGRIQYELTDKITGALEVSYAESEGTLRGGLPRFPSLTIRNDNAFLPAQVRAAMLAQNIPSFTMSRVFMDIGNLRTQVEADTPHVALSFNGEFADWKWDASYSWGRNNYAITFRNNSITQNYNFAVDAVRNPAGQIVCRATLPGATFNAAAAGCVPLNAFGEGSPSPEAINYVTGSTTSTSKYDQSVAQVNLIGQPFSTWAGPISLALGAEYRFEEQQVDADALGRAGVFLAAGNQRPYGGDFDVKEFYVDTIIPLAKDQAWAKSLDFNAAIRYADYSTVGEQTTWKLGATWEPMDGLRLRATRSKDIRAPAIYELTSPGSVITNSLTVRGVALAIPQNTTAGNPNLDAEKADTFTAGIVVEPTGALSGLRASIDYYDIKIEDAITNLSSANVANLCGLGNQAMCNLFTFSPTTGLATSLLAPALNVASYQNQGVDFVVSYQRDLSDWFSSVPGSLNTSLSGTYVFHAYIDSGAGGRVVDRVGELGQANFGSVPELRLNWSTTYTVGPASVTAQVLHTSAGVTDVTFNTNPTNTISDNSIDSATYLNLYGSYDVTPKIQLFGAIDNALNLDPPVSPYNVLQVPVNGTYFDKVGRAFRVGLTYTF